MAMFIAKTLDGAHFASDGYRTGAKHIPSQITVEEVFAKYGHAIDASHGFPLTLVKQGSWAAVRAGLSKQEVFAILGDPVPDAE